MNNTEEIEKDFGAKRDTYFQENYVNKTKANYLRRYRNQLIRSEINNLQTVKTVLDVGCGPAILYQELLEKCEEYHAMDLVASNLQKIKSKNDSTKIQVIQSDLDSFKPQENLYDVVISSGSIEYATNYESIIKGLIKSLKPGGTLIISFPNKKSPYRIWGEYGYRSFRNLFRKTKTPKYNRKLFSEGVVRNQFGIDKTDSNFSIEYFGLKMLPQPLDSLLEGIDYNILKHFNENPSKSLGKFSQEFLVVYNCEV
jgi:2-polyprenyl-3-methyl-5-hydroxy-6-metoxy-1,4-benzoquinol methylase